ncbi:hypothetical protein GX586_09265 [bacterium]|nr:hypothetical protein [bacterium]
MYLESRTFGSVEFVPLHDLAEAFGLTLRWFYEARRVELRNTVITLDFLANSRFVLVDKQDVKALKSPLLFVRGEAFVPASFIEGTLKPYYPRFQKQGRRTGGTRIVVLDPGHGGKDTGAIGYGGVREKDVVLDIARRVRSALVMRGVKVRMTRDDDVYRDLDERSEMANNVGAALLVSIHANAVSKDKRAISGCETFYLSKAQTVSDATTEAVENSAARNSLVSGWRFLPIRFKRLFLSRHFTRVREQSISLSRSVQNRVGAVAVGPNRGIKPANLAVLRNTYCPACLLEVGFVSNPTDGTYLSRASYRQKVADSIALGIFDYLDTL